MELCILASGLMMSKKALDMKISQMAQSTKENIMVGFDKGLDNLPG